jgi:hypothetical protein
MLPTIDADNIPARVIVSKESILFDRHRILFDFDFDWEQTPYFYDEIMRKLIKRKLNGILIKTRGGCHFIGSQVMTFNAAVQLCNDFIPLIDEQFIKIAKERKYFCLRVSQKYEKALDQQVDKTYPFHDPYLESKYNKLLDEYKNYFGFRKPFTFRKMVEAQKDLVTEYQNKVVGSPQPVYENGYSDERSTQIYNSSY